MRRVVKLFLPVALSAMLAPTASAQAGDVVTATANVEIVAGLSITNTVGLDFGDMFAPGAAGSVVVSPAGALSVSGVTHAGGTVSAASFNVNQTQGQPIFYVVIPTSITISNGSDTMVVDTFTTNVTNPGACVTSGGAAPGPRGQCPKAPFVLTVGATLRVGANQPFGAYTGTFDVTVNMF